MAAKSPETRRKENIIVLNNRSTLNLPVDRVCDAAKEVCEKVLIIGVDKEGNSYYAANFADKYETNFMVSQFLHKLMNGDFEER